MGLIPKNPPTVEELLRRGLDSEGRPLPKKEAAALPKKAAPKSKVKGKSNGKL
jgi:hypothetical protein